MTCYLKIRLLQDTSETEILIPDDSLIYWLDGRLIPGDSLIYWLDGRLIPDDSLIYWLDG